MRTKELIDQDIAHIQYAKSVLEKQYKELIQERSCLNQDEFCTKKITRQLAMFFKNNGLSIVALNSGERPKEHYSLAKQMWSSRMALLPFAKMLSQNKEVSFEYKTEMLSKGDRNNIKNFCDVLSKRRWISFEARSDCFLIKPSLSGVQKQFFSGGWAEDINLYLIDKTLKVFTQSYQKKYKLFWDVRLKRIDSDKNNSHDVQLDLVAEVGCRFYVFETKSGTNLSIEKWVERKKIFENKGNRFITCTLNEDINPSIFKPFHLFFLPTLEEKFLKMLKNDFNQSGASLGKDNDCQSE